MAVGDAKTTIRGRLFEAGQKGQAEGYVENPDAIRERLAEDGPYDLVVGINTKNVDTTIVHVMNVVCEGLQLHFPAMKCLVVVSDGYSSDETMKLAEFYPTPRGIRKLVATQSGGPGKGNGVRTILEVARLVDAHACAFVDGDLVSIRPIWVDNLLRPILHGLTDVVVPYYLRDKWDGVITNHLCYPFTAALYGSSVRQPIGGEYGLSRPLYERILDQGDVPEHFGIDIYLTTTAIAEGFRIQEAPLGIKTHASTRDYTDPRKSLSRMYEEVVGTLLDLARKYEDKWRVPPAQAAVLLSENVVSYYDRLPPRTAVNENTIRAVFLEGVEANGKALERMLPRDLFDKLQGCREKGIPSETWARMVYAITAWYIARPGEVSRGDVLNGLGALGMGRFLSFVHETAPLGLQEAYALIQEQGRTFQRLRPEFIHHVDTLRTAVTP